MSAPPPRPSTELGNPAAWVDQHGNQLLQFALTRIDHRETAEDLVQETFLAAFKSRGDFDGRSAFSTWLIAILRRKIIDHYRKTARTPAIAEVELDETPALFDSTGHWRVPPAHWGSPPSQHAENSEFWEIVRQCLDRLPRHLAQAFELREIADATVQEASEIAGVTPRNLSVRLHRSRLLLRGCLEQKWFAAGADVAADCAQGDVT